MGLKNDVVGDDGQWRNARGRRGKARHKRIGTAEVSEKDKTQGFVGSERKVWLYINRVMNHVKPENIRDYICKKKGFDNVNIGIRELQGNSTSDNANSLKSFVVTAPLEKKEEMYREDFWPVGVGVRRFSFKTYHSRNQSDDFLVI